MIHYCNKNTRHHGAFNIKPNSFVFEFIIADILTFLTEKENKSVKK